MTVLYIFLTILLAQRAVELIVARRHEHALKAAGAEEIDSKGYRLIVTMHAAFFISIPAETILLNRRISSCWELLLVIFAAAQLLRYWAIASLGTYWNTKIIIAPGHPLVVRGPYKYFRHPNYLAVITEIAVVPLIFSCYYTAIVFTLLNAAVLKRRIRIENDALRVGGNKKMPDGITT